MPQLSLINAGAFKKCGVLDGHALRILNALKKEKDRPVKQSLGVVFSSCVFWYSALATLWCDKKSFGFFAVQPSCVVNHAMMANEITRTIRSHNERLATIHNPPRNNNNHP